MTEFPRRPPVPDSIYSMEEQDYWDREREKRGNPENLDISTNRYSRYEKEDGRHLRDDGTWVWYKNQHIHRADGPAILIPRLQQDSNMTRYAHIWVHNDIIHRNDGPAVVYEDGTTEWFIDGTRVIPEGFDILKYPPWFKTPVDSMIWLQQIERYREELARLGRVDSSSARAYPGSMI